MFSLQKLHDKQHISSKDYQALTSAYTFLRRIEHRLQLRRGQQLHQLPEGEDELRVLCASMVSRGSEPPSVEGFMEELQRHMASVSDIYGRIIHSEQQHGHEAASADDFVLSPTLASAAREPSYNQILERIAADAPELYQTITQQATSEFARRNLHRFLSSAMTTTPFQPMSRFMRSLVLFRPTGPRAIAVTGTC